MKEFLIFRLNTGLSRVCSVLTMVLVLLVFGSCSFPNESESRCYLIQDVNVITMETDEILESRNVLIRNNQIERISRGFFDIPRNATFIDGKGMFLLPGFSDMHVHIDHKSELDLYPLYGVTSVLNMRGMPHHLNWRDSISDHLLFGPYIYTCGDYMTGYPPDFAPYLSFENAQDAAQSVSDQKKAGYDFIKAYDGLTYDQLLAITAQAKKVGIPVVGHADPNNYTIAQLIDAGQVNLAHGEEIFGYLDGLEDRDKIDEIVRAFFGKSITLTPNLNFYKSLIRQKEDMDSLLNQPEAGMLHPAIFQPFRPRNNAFYQRDSTWLNTIKKRFPVLRHFTKSVHDKGVLLLTGTDASTRGVYPGYSLHEELEELVNAGLTPFESLETATRNAGEFFMRNLNLKRKFGIVKEGYAADLVLLQRNPLVDIKNSRTVVGVFLDGEWHSYDEMKIKVDSVSARYTKLTEAVITLENLMITGDMKAARHFFDSVRTQFPNGQLFSQYVPLVRGWKYLYDDDGFNDRETDRQGALELYKMYAETFPYFHSSFYFLGESYLATGDTARAVQSYSKALEIHPYSPDAKRRINQLE